MDTCEHETKPGTVKVMESSKPGETNLSESGEKTKKAKSAGEKAVKAKAYSAGSGEEMKKSKERYFLVKFSGKTNEFQPQNVYIAINGVPLVAQRNTPVVMPESYLEVARHSNIETFDIDAEGNKTAITIANYPFDTICEATEEDYKMLLGRKGGLSPLEVERIKSRSMM